MTIIYVSKENCNVIFLAYVSGKITNNGILTKRMRNMWEVADLAAKKHNIVATEIKMRYKIQEITLLGVKMVIKIPAVDDTIVSTYGRYYA